MVSPETAEARSRRRTAGTLTVRQREVLALIADGMTNAQIADRLGVTLSAAKWHVSEIIAELGVGSREEAAHWWRREQGLPTRLRRWAVAPLAWGKPLAIGAAAAVVVVAAMGVALALRGADNNGAGVAPDPTATATTAPGATETVPPPTAPASPTAATQLATYPVPRTGTLVYTVVVGEGGTENRTWPERAVVVQDLASGNIGATWRYSGTDLGYPIAAVLAGDYVITATEQRITRYHLDGSGEFILFEHNPETDQGAITDIAASPDGSLVAFGTLCYQCGPEHASYFLRVADGGTVARIPTTDLRDAGYIGFPWQFFYRADGAGVFIAGGTGSERPGGLATLRPDGTFTIHNAAPEGYGVVSPDGGMVAEGYGLGGECMHVAGSRMRIFDHADDTIIFDYAPEGRLIAPWEWSPDGSKLLVLTIPPHPPECTPPPPGQQEFLLLDVPTFTFEPVADVRALHGAWYGDGLQQWCEDPSDTNPVVSRWGDRSVPCAPSNLNAAAGDLFLGSTRIASGITPPTPAFGGIGFVGLIE